MRQALPWFAAVLTLAALCAADDASAAEKPLPAAAPETFGIAREQLAKIDAVVNATIARGALPGAVVVVVHRGRVIFRKAYGARSLQPQKTAMTPEIVFDLASLTKPIATATSILLLVEQGKLKLTYPVSRYVPAFKRKETEGITVAHLLLHTSGLIADNALADYRAGRDQAWERIGQLQPTAAPGTRFTYSDMGYILLGKIVEQVSGLSLDEFARKHVFAPLGMNETTFRPQGELKRRAAPTEQREGRWMQGEVHDPRSYLLGGVTGHAGLFSTADDLAVYAQMLLNSGAYAGKRVLKAETIRLMTAPQKVPQAKKGSGLRTYGWDMVTAYSSNRGELFPKGESFGHTGFTGTSIWIDPRSQSAVIFLSNRVHPAGKGNVTKLRSQVATLAARAILQVNADEPAPVLTGLDVLVRDQFAALKGRKVGLVTNHTGIDRQGRAAIDLLHQAPGVQLLTLFSPEHGIRGALDAQVPDGKDDKTGLPIYSLYGKRRKPDAASLKGLDTLVFDIQDAGCRFYTYISTLGLVLEASAEHKLKVVVLDRPNPLGGVAVEGPVLDAGRESFVAHHRLPIRHGMTVGELALLFNKERKLNADVQVIKMEGWRRSDFYDRTNLTWVNPSPNLRGLSAALLYPGVGILETTNVSVGRGTEKPFEWFGAPWLDGPRVTAALQREQLLGIRFVPMQLTPKSSVHAGKLCGGVNLIVDDWRAFQPVRTGLALAATLRKLYPQAWKAERYDVLLGHKATFLGLLRGDDWRALEQAWQPGLEAFLQVRRGYLLYE